MQIGSKLKKIRELKNLKQEDIAERLNISKQAYSKIERDETRLDLERVISLGEILGINPYELMTGEFNNLNINQPKDCDNQQFSNQTSTINNHYYYGDEHLSVLQNTIDLQNDTIRRLESEIDYLRKLLKEQLGQ